MIETYILDSFTSELFKGNPAGVCILERPLGVDKMQAIAKELGLSETAFVKKEKKSPYYAIRFFSPVTEIPLCGHATLAASKVLFENNPTLNSIQFKTIEALILEIRKEAHQIEMIFPVYDTIPQKAPMALLRALGIKEIINSVYNEETNILLLEIEDSDVLAKLAPNFVDLIASHNTINGILVTAPSKQSGYDFESRYFWPWSGTNEDPVTGATHTFLTKYWSTRLGKTKMHSFQCSERTGSMIVELIGEDKMTIKGEAQIVLKGELRL